MLVTALLALLLLLLLVAVAVAVALANRRNAAAAGRPPQGTGGPAAPADPFADLGEVAGDPRKLKAGDMVEYLGRRYFVRGSLRLSEGGYSWSEHFLDDTEGTRRWLSVEEDPELEIVMWVELPDSGLTPSERTLTVDGVEYRRTEHGTAGYRSEGTTGLGDTGRVEYADYEAAGGQGTGRDGAAQYLAFERFGGDGWEAGLGERVPVGTLTIYPGS
jgi:hypothetical protein